MDGWPTEELTGPEIGLPVNASFKQELIAIAAVLAVLLLGLFAIWAADEIANLDVTVSWARALSGRVPHELTFAQRA
jgi:hypothetical protein